MKHLYHSLKFLLALALCTAAVPLWSATYTVINTNDSGAGSLRQAIIDANANPGSDDIVFNIVGSAPFSIVLASALPALTGPTVIDGSSLQPGYTQGTQATYVKVGTAYTGTIFSATNVTGITIKGLDLSYSSPRQGAGIGFTNCNQTFILDNYIRNRRTGIAINGGQDHTVQNNDLLASGENTNEPCVYLLNITPGSIPSGIAMSGNKFGGNANMGFRFDNMNNLVIRDVSVSGVNIVIEDNSGFTAMGLAGQFMLWFNNCNNITIDDVDLSWLGGSVSNSHGIIFSNSVTNSTFTVKNCSIKNRYSGIQIGNGKDVTIQNNDLRGSGHENNYAVNLNNITEANVNGGILMSDNLWGRNAGVAECNGGLRLSNTNNLIIGDENTGVNIIIKDNSGFNTILGNTSERNAMYLENVSNITVDNVDVSWSPGGVASNMGIRVQNTGSNGNITIKDCKVQNRYYGIYCNDGKDYTITGNDLRGSGHENLYALYLLSIAEGMIPGGVLVSGNLWGRNTGVAESNGGLYIADMSNLVIGDLATGVHIKIEDNSGFNTILGTEGSYRGALLLERVSNITVDDVDASWSLGGISNSFGIFVQNETSQYSGQTTSHRNVTIKNCDFRNRGIGIRIRGGKDYTVTNNDLRGCGEHGHHALQLINIQAGTLTGGILAHTNKFGTGAAAINNGIYIQQMNDLTIGDAGTGGNIQIEDNSGLNQIVGNDVNNRGALYLNTVSNVTVNSVDCSYATSGQAGNSFGIRVANTASNSNISLLNCNAGNRGRGIWVDNGRDYTITGNNMVGSGNGNPAFELSNIIPGSLTGGILASGNTFGTPNFNRGVAISNMRDLLIGDASVLNANFVLEDISGLNQCVGGDYNSQGALYLSNVNNVTVDNVDCSKSTTGASNSYGIVVANGANNQGITIKNCKADNRYRGIYCFGGKDYTVQNNTITNSGWDGEACALDFRNVTAGTLTGGVLVSGNTFGNVPITANLSRAGVRFDNMRDLYISDGSINSNVKLEDASGLTAVGFDANSNYNTITLSNVSNSTLDNLDVSSAFSGPTQRNFGIRINNSASQGNVTIKDCNIQDRRTGIYIANGRDYTITGNNLTNTGANSSEPAVWLNSLVKNTLDGGIAMSGNTFGGATANTALRLTDMREFTIGDAGVSGADIVLEDGVLSTVGNGLDNVVYLSQINNVVVDNVDFSRTGGTQHGLALRVENGNGNGTISVVNCDFGTRRTGIYIGGGKDYTIQNNDFTNSGPANVDASLWFNGVIAGTLPGGLSVSGNTFGGTNANTAVRFENLKDIVIGNASVMGRNVTFEDGTSGLSTVGNNATSLESVLYFSNLTNSSISNVDLTRTGGTQFGQGIYVANGLTSYPFSITNCAVGNRRTGIYINGGRDYTVQNNNLTGSGATVNEPALYLNSLTVNNNLLINGNTFGGANFHTGVRVENTSDLLISNGTVSGTHIGVTTANGLGNATGYALYLANLTRTKVQNMDLSFTSATKTGVGIQVTINGGSTAQVEMKSLIVKNRVDGINITSGANHSVKCSDLSDNNDGLDISSGVTSFTCEQNSFVGNTTYAINSSATITAENNFFGGGAPPVGTPNGVTASVDATPFLAAAPANCPTTLAAYLELKGNQNLILNGSMTPVTANHTDLGSVKTGTPLTRTFTINNTGGVTLNITSISFTGGNAGDFSASALTPASPVPAGGSATFTITFTPGATGLRSTTLSIVNDDPNNNPFTAALQGTGKNVLVVTKTADTNDGVCDADCSLREAITVANSNADADVIEFNIGSGAQTITHTTALPNITQPLSIDGTTQPGYAGTPLITVNSNSSLTTFNVSGVTGFTVKGMDLSRPDANFDGLGINLTNCNTVSIQNNKIRNRLSGIVTNGGYDYIIQNNDLKNTGWRESEPAVWLRSLTSRAIAGGVTMSGNVWGDLAGANNYAAGSVLRIDNMNGLIIGDASVSGRHITIEDGASGLTGVQALASFCCNAYLMYFSNVNDFTIDNVDMSYIAPQQGFGIFATGSNVVIKNCNLSGRLYGINCQGGKDYTIQNNNLTQTGNADTQPALYLNGIGSGSIAGGVSVTGNTFGGSSTSTALRVDNMRGLVIGDASVSGAHIVFDDATSGLPNVEGIQPFCCNRSVMIFNNVSDLIIDNVNLSRASGYNGFGIEVNNSTNNSTVTIKKCAMQNRVKGIHITGGKDYTLTNNDLRNVGNDNTNPAIYLSGIRPGVQPAGVVASGNQFGFLTQTAKTALRIDNMDGLFIGDAVGGGVHIAIEDASGANTMNNDADAAVIYLSAVSNLTVNDVDVSRSAAGRTGAGIWVENGGSTVYRNLSILNCKMQQRDMALYISGGKDATVTNNDMRYSGSYQDRPALWLNNIQSGTLPGGVSMSGNKFGGTFNSATSNSGIQFANMRDLVMADAAAPGVNIVLEDNSGLNDVYGDEVSIRGVMYLNNVRNVQMTSIDLSKMTALQGTSYALKANNCVNVSVLNGKGSNRYHGYYFEGGRDITVTGNDLTGSGNVRDYPALRFSNVQPGSVNTANGIAASGNLFGGANVRTGLRIDNAKNLLIRNTTAGGAHIVIEDNSGLNNITQGDGNSEHPAILLSTVSDITVDNVDASRPSGQDAGGIWVSNSITNSNITIKNCNFNRHRRAIYCTGGRDYTLQNNSLLNSGSSNDQPAIYLQNIQQGSLTGGILMSGNTFGGTSSFAGIRFENMRDLSIGDENTGGNVTIEDNSGLNNMGGNGSGTSSNYVLYFNNVNNATVDNVDLSRPVGATTAQDFTGIRIDNGAAYGPITIKDCNISRHRVGISAQGGKDYTVTGNDLRGCGGSSDDPALWFNGITQQNGTVPMGILANTNTFGTVNSVVSNCALRLDNLCGIRISDGTVPNSHIKIAAASGIKEVTGTSGNSPAVILMANTSGMAVEKLDLEFSGTQTGTGIRLQNSNASQYSFSIKDNILKNRRMGVYIINGADYTITGNNFSMTGVADDEPAIRMEHVAEGTLYGGVSMSGNTFGGTGAAFGLKFVNMSNLKISDGSLSGTNVNLGLPAANGLYNVTTGNVLQLSGICNATVGMLDLSRAGLTRQGVGLRMNAGMGNTIEKVLVGNRDKGIEIAGGSNSQSFTCNTLFDNNLGIDVVLGTLLSTTLTNNIMDCNGVGLRSTSTSTVAASNNYWGTANGSTTSGGSGDSYSGTVTATPFLAAAPVCAQTPPDLETKANNVEIVDGDITPSFNDYTQYCAVTGQTQTRTYTLKNTGNGIMNLTGANPVTLAPASGTPFTITSQPSDLELLPGETTTFSIQFAPVALGTSNVTLNIASKDCRENPYNFALKGQGCVDIQGTISGSQAICAGQPANLTVNISAGLAPFVVTLSDGSTFTVNNIGDNTVTVNPTTTTTYTIAMITDANGCCSTNTGSAIVTVNPLPTPTITVSETSGTMNHDGFLCAGASATLDAGVFAAYAWSPSGNTQTITANGSGTYTVTVTDGNGCQNTDIQAIVVNPNPTPTITETDNSGTANDNILCAGGSATLDAGGYSSYAWTPSGNTQSISVNAAGTYTVVVTDVNGCTGTDDQAIAVNAVPEATLSGALLVCPGTTSTMINLNITAGVAPFTVVLSDASSHNVASTGPGTLNVTVAGPGTNTFTITSITGAGGCAGSASGTATVDFGSAGEIEISGNSTPITDGDNTPVTGDHTDFGNVLTSSNFTRTFTITNSHPTLPLNISGVNITGSTAFTLMTPPAGSVAANGGTTTFVVKFSPLATGLASATVEVSSTDCDEQPYNFAIQGTGTEPGAALHFDGVNDLVDLGTGMGNFGTGDFTLETWFKVAPAATGYMPLIAKRGICSHSSFWNIFMIAGKVYFEIDESTAGDNYLSISTPLAYNDNNWHHVACTRSGTAMKLYLDGVLVASGNTAAPTNLNNAVSIKIGSQSCGNFIGSMDELRIWTEARTCDQITQLRNCELSGSEPNLVAYYNFNQGFAAADNTTPPVNTLPDLAGGDQNGTLTGFALTGASSNWVTPGGVTTGTSCPAVTVSEADVQGGSPLVSILDGDATPSTNDSTDFGNVAVNGSRVRTFKIFNTGNDALTINSITSDNVKFVVSGAPTSVAANDSKSFTVTFNPTALGVQNATITVNTNDCDEAVYDFSVTGKGATPASALHFDGGNDYISTPNNTTLDLSTQTVELWAKPSGSGGDNDLLVGKRNYNGTNNSDIRWSIHFQNGNEGLYFYSPAGLAVWTYAFTPNQWYHIAMVTDATSTKLYIDGAFISSKATTINSPTNLPLLFGASAPNFEVFPGSLDEVRIWNTARTCDQISQLRNCELAGSEPGLMAYYKFNQGFAAEDNTTPPVNTLTDATANANNGTLTGFALTGASSNWVTPGGVISGTSCPAVVIPEINVQGGSPLVSILDGDATPSTTDGTDFGNVAVNGSRVRTFTIFNTGTGVLTVNSITSDNVKFVVSGAPTSVAANGGSATFTVTFNPTALGVQNATITINSTDCDEAVYDFVVTGKGATPASALSFDGVNDDVIIPHASNITFNTNEDFTISLYVKIPSSNQPNSATIDNSILEKTSVGGGGYPYVMRYYNHTSGAGTNGKIYAARWNGSVVSVVTSTVTLNDDTWHHVSFVKNGATIYLYVDGVLNSTAADITSGSTFNTAPLYICSRTGSNNWFKGDVDNLQIWNVARSCEEIRQLRNCEMTGSEPNLVAYYNFNQGFANENNSGVTTLTDAAGGDNNGTLNNFALTGTASNWVTPGGVVTGTSCPVSITYPEANVRGNSTNIADGDITPSTTDHTDFGLIAVNGSLVRTFTIQNTGTAALTITSITSSNALFVVGGAPTSVAANGSETFTVTFNPTALGVQNATITINSNDCDEAVYDFVVTGKGATPASALHFDGVNDNVSIPNTAALQLDQFTLETWFNPSTAANFPALPPALIAKGAGGNPDYFMVPMFNSRKILAGFWAGATPVTVISTTDLAQNTWYHLATTFDGTTLKMYVNGVLENTVPAAGLHPQVTTNALSLGLTNGTQYVNGALDEVRIWNVARSCEEIRQLRNCELTGSEGGLVAYYNFNQGFAAEDNTTPPVNTLIDAAGGDNNGTLNGFALSGAASNWITPGGVTTGTSCPASITYPEADLLGHDNTPLADGTTSTSVAQGTNFGSVNFGSSSAAKTFTIQNNGTTALNVTSIVSSDPQFAVTALTPASPVAAGIPPATFTITFTPTATGVQNATITINNDDCDEAIYTFAVTGTGVCIPPSFSACPTGPLTATTLTGTCAAPVNYTVTEAGNPAPTVAYTFTGATTGSGTGTGSGSSFNKGNTTVTVTATSTCSPPATCSFTVTVTDNEKPTISCTGNITQNTNVGACVATVTVPSPTATDNCSPTNTTNGLNFDGVNDYVTVPSGSFTSYTIETWVKFTGTTTANQAMVYFTDGTVLNVTNEIGTDNSGHFLHYLWDGNARFVVGTTVAALNTWYHVAIVATNSGQMRLYINGVEEGTPVSIGTMQTAGNQFVYGKQAFTNSYFQGTLDEMRVWTQVRSQAQIQSAMNVELAGNEPGLYRYHRFNEGIANGDNTALTSILATTGANGTPVNMALNGPISNFVPGKLAIPVAPAMTNSFNGTSDASGNYPIGTTTVTWTATDASSNTETCQQTVTVVDNQAPTLTNPGNQALNVLANSCAANYTIADPVSDNCTSATWGFTLSGATVATVSGIADGTGSSVLSFDKGVTTVVLSATDGTNTATTVSFTVTVTDNIAPQITCAGPVTVNTTAELCTGTATLTDPTVTDNCPLGNGLDFGGDNDFVSFPSNVISAATAFTFETWINPRSHASWARIFDFGNGLPDLVMLSSSVGGSGMPAFYIFKNGGSQQVIAPSAIPLNTWTHIAVTLSGTTATMYINGVQVAQNTSFTLNPAIVGATTNNWLGRSQQSGDSYLDGKLDEVRFWNVARSQAQIQASMNGELFGNESGLVAYYRLNQGIASGNNAGITTAIATAGPTGTLNNFALNGASSNWVRGAFGALTNDAPTNYPKGITTVTWTATDANGNTATCQQTVTVVDNQAPTLVNPGNQALNVPANSCAANYTIADPVSDNCTSATWGYTLSGATTASVSGIADGTGSGVLSFNKGVTTVVLSATDGTNTATTVSFTVTVTDNIAPTITCSGPVTVNTTAELCTGTATLTEPTVTDNCPFGGNGLNFDGNDDRVATAAYNGTALTGDLTMECWFKGSSLNGRALFGRGFQQEFDLTLWSNQLTYYHGNGSSYAEVNFSHVFTNNTWYHVAVVRNTSAQTVSLYVNGVFQQTLSYGTPLPVAQTAEFRIGNRAAGQFFLGSIDEVRVWTVARTPAQIAANWNLELAAQPDLFALYHLNEGIANGNNAGVTTAADASGNAKDGTLTTFALSGTSSNWGIGAFGGVTNNAPATYPKGNTTVTWTATDASGNTQTCQQTVTVIDNQAPTLANPGNQALNVLANSCAADYTIADPVSDNCTGATWGYTLSGATTATVSGIADGTGSGVLSFNKGVTTVTFSATDGTNTATTVSFTVTVTDNIAPTISCPSNKTVAPTNNSPCSAVVNSIDATYDDNCTPTLSYALSGVTTGSGSGQASGQTFLVGTTTVTYTVSDGGLNTSCMFTVTVTNCNIEFSGQIEWSDDQETGVNNATVNVTGAGTGSDATDVNGDYLASVPYTTGTFIITPVKNTNKLNGITSADATAIQQHITGAAPITNPYRMIAADVNKSNSITTADATVINQALLGSPSALAQFKTSWRFVPQTHTMSMPPWGFPEKITLTGVSSNQTGKDFFGIKTGDLVSVWTNPSTLGAGEPLVLRVQDQVLQAGSEIEAEFRADQLNDLAAWQFALRFDPEQLQLAVVQPLPALPLTLEDFGLLNISEGEIRTAWSQAAGLALEEAAPVFRLKFNVLKSGGKLSDALQLANGLLPGRVYNSALAESGVTLEYSALSGSGPVLPTGEYVLMQNVPNPFVQKTSISFVLPGESEGALRIFDAAGRLLAEHKGWYPRGRSNVDFDLKNQSSGLLYYELTTSWGVLSRKMILSGN